MGHECHDLSADLRCRGHYWQEAGPQVAPVPFQGCEGSSLEPWCSTSCRSETHSAVKESQLRLWVLHIPVTSAAIKVSLKQSENQSGNAAVCGPVLTAASCCDTVTLLNDIFSNAHLGPAGLLQHNLHNHGV